MRELFEETANSAPSPSRLVADEVYAAGRHRRRLRAVANCGVAVALAMTAVTGLAWMVRQEPSVNGEVGIEQEQSLPGVLPHRGERIQWAGAADARHLYLTMSTLSSCSSERCAKTIVQLVGSDDGGRTWSDRGGPINAFSFAVLGPGQLLAVFPAEATSAGTRTLQISTDGGRTWHTLDRAPAVAAVPTGSTAVCWPEPDQDTSRCTVHALDPGSHRIKPLASQPPLNLSDDLRVGESAGRLWASGIDPATGRPAVAVSRNAGRTWSTQVFADAPACSQDGCLAPYLTTGDGPMGYAVVVGVQHRAVYRNVEDDGRSGWQRVLGADSVPADRLVGGAQSFVTADGTHVLLQVVGQRGQGVDEFHFWAARDGGVYQPVELDGLPATVTRSAVRRMAGSTPIVLPTVFCTGRLMAGTGRPWPATRKTPPCLLVTHVVWFLHVSARAQTETSAEKHDSSRSL